MQATITPDWSALGPIAQAIIISLIAVITALAGVVATLYLALIKSKDARIEDGTKHIADDAVRDAQLLETLRQIREKMVEVVS